MMEKFAEDLELFEEEKQKNLKRLKISKQMCFVKTTQTNYLYRPEFQHTKHLK